MHNMALSLSQKGKNLYDLMCLVEIPKRRDSGHDLKVVNDLIENSTWSHCL